MALDLSETSPIPWTVICAVNNESILKSCLLKSPDLRTASDIFFQSGFSSAGAAYNDGIKKAKTDLLVFLHQDMYLPKGWFCELERALANLSRTDPQWGVAGGRGASPSGDGTGFIYCHAAGKVLGVPFEGGQEVQSLDEVVLILRKSTDLRFDESLPGFHLYGTDICLQAKQRGMKSYAISAFCLHNTNGLGMLPLQFWKAYLVMRNKWKNELPIQTPCTKITRWCWPMIRWNLARSINVALGRAKPPATRAKDAGQLYQELLASPRASLDTPARSI